MTNITKLTRFEQFIQSLWPFDFSPVSMKHFCDWYESTIDNISTLSSEEKSVLKHKGVEIWINLNICKFNV